jgi:hypothetical protein
MNDLGMLFESLARLLHSTSHLHLVSGPVLRPEATPAVSDRIDLECQPPNYTASELAPTASVASLQTLVVPGKNSQAHCDLNGT